MISKLKAVLWGGAGIALLLGGGCGSSESGDLPSARRGVEQTLQNLEQGIQTQNHAMVEGTYAADYNYNGQMITQAVEEMFAFCEGNHTSFDLAMEDLEVMDPQHAVVTGEMHGSMMMGGMMPGKNGQFEFHMEDFEGRWLITQQTVSLGG